jgi:hypothetical protein
MKESRELNLGKGQNDRNVWTGPAGLFGFRAGDRKRSVDVLGQIDIGMAGRGRGSN